MPIRLCPIYLLLTLFRADIDYMHGYRDFDNDQNRFSYEDTEIFLDNLHAGGRHFVPIVDAALYIPNPENESDT